MVIILIDDILVQLIFNIFFTIKWCEGKLKFCELAVNP